MDGRWVGIVSVHASVCAHTCVRASLHLPPELVQGHFHHPQCWHFDPSRHPKDPHRSPCLHSAAHSLPCSSRRPLCDLAGPASWSSLPVLRSLARSAAATPACSGSSQVLFPQLETLHFPVPFPRSLPLPFLWVSPERPADRLSPRIK